MEKPVLLVMAAGMGSRFGGDKQITPVDDSNHVIMDFSIYDAMRAGFSKVVIIIKRSFEEGFRRDIGDRIARNFALEYAFQELSDLPAGFSVPEGRVKPWGTAHAVLSARELIAGPFCAINADDFYGFGAFKAAYDFLSAERPASEHAMVGYRIENTLTENGAVARGVCDADESGMLRAVNERTYILPAPGGANYSEDGCKTFTFIPKGTIVSMNMWCFGHSMMGEIGSRFVDFLRANLPVNPLKCEYYLPAVPNAAIREGVASARVLETEEKWYGMTYQKDLITVKAAIAAMKAEGKYPERLWR